MKRLLLSAFFSVCLCGCILFDPLPPGKAPAGAIVDNKAQKAYDVRSAVNYMTTSLSIYLLTDPLKGNAVTLDSDEETRSGARMVLDELASVTGLKEQTAAGTPVLKTRFVNDGWEFQLLSSGRILWKERLNLTLCRKKEEIKK